MEPVHYVGIIAQWVTYASFLSGAKVCYLIHKQRSCAQLSPIPFLAGLNCLILWLRYGFIADEKEIIMVNEVGLILQVVYIGFFMYYSKQKLRVLKQLLCLIVFLLTLLSMIEYSFEQKFLSGLFAAISSLIACAAPLATIQDVLRTRCVSSLPFPMIASSFMVSFSWLIYGFMKDDNFVVFSNIVAVAISGAQLFLFAIYPSTLPYEKLSQSNKKSYDLIKLLNSDVDEFENFEVSRDSCLDEIDTNQDYKETLAKIMGQIYFKREQLAKKNPSTIMLLFMTGHLL